MDFQQYLQSQQPGSAMAGSMAGPTGGGFGQLAMQMLQQNRPQAQTPIQPGPLNAPGGPSHPDPGPGAQQMQTPPTAPMAPGGGMPAGGGPGAMGGPQMQDPEFQRGFELGQMLRQLMGQ